MPCCSAQWCGLCLLSKYYAVVLILTCLGASFAHPAWRQYYRSACPWIAVATATVLFLPHAIWALLSDAPPVHYALGLTGIGARSTIGYTLNLLLEVTLFHVVVVAIVLLSSRRRTEDMATRAPHRAFLTALAFLPLALTVLFETLLRAADRTEDADRRVSARAALAACRSFPRSTIGWRSGRLPASPSAQQPLR